MASKKKARQRAKAAVLKQQLGIEETPRATWVGLRPTVMRSKANYCRQRSKAETRREIKEA